MFEGIAKTNTTNTVLVTRLSESQFEGIAKTNTTNTGDFDTTDNACLRVLLKQIQQTLLMLFVQTLLCLRVLLKQIQQTLINSDEVEDCCLRVLLKQIQQTQAS